MQLEDAVDIVMELAQQGVLEDDQVSNDQVRLDMQQQQQEAVNTVHDFFVNNIFD